MTTLHIGHSTKGASSSKRWMNCAASVPLNDLYPNVTSPYAAEGTVAHMVCEDGLKDQLPASHYIGQWGDGSEKHKHDGLYAKPQRRTNLEFEVTDEMAKAVQIYLDAVNHKMEELQLGGYEPELMVEIGFNLQLVMNRDDMFGTNDSSIWVPRYYLGVFDYKHGKGEVVEVEDNSQLMYYALGALIVLCWDDITGWFDEDKLPEIIELCIVQPRAGHANGPIRRWPMTPQALIDKFIGDLKGATTKIDALEALIKTSGKKANEVEIPVNFFSVGDWCKWCKAKGICPSYRKEMQAAMRESFDDDGLSIEELGDIMDKETKGMVTKSGANKGSPSAKLINAHTKAKANEMAKLVCHTNDPETLKRLLNAAGLLEAFAKEIRLISYNMVSQGTKLPDYKLVRQATKRRWAGDQIEIADTLTLFLDEDQIYSPRELKSFTEIEALSAEAAGLVVGLTERPEGALVLVKETDKREGVTPSAADVFEGDTLELSELN